MGISLGIKILLGFSPDTDDEIVRKWWGKRTKSICKPCWELKYCPYGPLVEDFPLLPPTKTEAIEHNIFLKEQLAKGAYDEERRKIFIEEVNKFNPDDYPERHSQEELDMSCEIFGHLYPVFFANEPVTETSEWRRIGRHIPTKMKMRIVRRDNYTCQVCGKHLKDDEIEFDHMIPVSKGGSSEEQNIRLVCYNCNRRKGNRVDL
ncbi:MAG: HNH endonuclease signature motif containing protein [Dehalococcoidales bacterium]